MARSTLRVITSGDYPINYVPTLKVGCTYVKNLFYYLEHGELYPKPNKIHDSHVSSRAEIYPPNPNNDFRFTIVRDPIDRVLSLYFDKVIGTGPQTFPWISKQLSEKREFVFSPKTLGDHRTNINALIGYLRLRINKFPPGQLNPHWRPQIQVAKKVKDYGFDTLLLERLDDQLLQLMAGKIPDLKSAMDAVKSRNESVWTISKEEVMTANLREQIEKLYADDLILYHLARERWDGAS